MNEKGLEFHDDLDENMVQPARSILVNVLYSCIDIFKIIFHGLHPILKVSDFLWVKMEVYTKLSAFYKNNYIKVRHNLHSDDFAH